METGDGQEIPTQTQIFTTLGMDWRSPGACDSWARCIGVIVKSPKLTTKYTCRTQSVAIVIEENHRVAKSDGYCGGLYFVLKEMTKYLSRKTGAPLPLVFSGNMISLPAKMLQFSTFKHWDSEMLINLFGLLLNWFGSYQRQLNVWT